MDERLSKIERLFQAAADLPVGERAGFLAREAGDDADLQAEVQALLSELESSRSLGMPTVASDLLGDPLTEGPGTIIGRYKLLQRLGEGGFGVVYMAEQQHPVVRKVALKIIKLGMDTKEVVARFEAERQALALMDHPNIARVFDAGATDTGRPYFVMELIRGIPITDYCDKNHLETAQRLELFSEVCRAVQHAHQKGIIHRDIKPSNVMVTLHDGTPVPKIIDFGIAKATNQRLTERTLFTEYHQFIGTPAYMSPEQAEMSGLDVDTRTDIYSLGVLLYELLTGTTPFDNKELFTLGYAEIQRIIREVDPPLPSTRISTLGESLTAVAQNRKLDPAGLTRLIRGDLDWIVMKALEKDRTRRYGTASAMAEDVERYLGDRAVEASPPGAIYQFRKLIRRNRAAVVTFALVAGALVLGLIGTTWGMLAASRQRDSALAAREDAVRSRTLAVDEATRAQAVTDFLVEMLAQTDPVVTRSDDPSVRTVLDDAAAKVSQSLGQQPEAEAAVRTTIGRAYASLGELELAEVHLKRAAELYRGLDDVDTAAAYETMWLLTHVLFELERGDSFAVAQEARDLGLATVAATVPELSRILDAHIDAVGQADIDNAHRYFEQSRRVARESLPAGDPLWVIYADCLMQAAYSIWYTQVESAAEPYLVEALAVRRRELSPGHPHISRTLNVLVSILNRAEEFEKAEAYVRESIELSSGIGANHPLIAYSQMLLGQSLVGQQRYADAEEVLLAANRTLTESRGHANFSNIDALLQLVDLYESWGRGLRAAEYRDRLAHALVESKYPMPWTISGRVFGPEHQRLVDAVSRLPLPVGGAIAAVNYAGVTESEWAAIAREVVDARRVLLEDPQPRATVLARVLVDVVQEWGSVRAPDARRLLFEDVATILRNGRARLPLDDAVAHAERASAAGLIGDRAAAQRYAVDAMAAMATYNDPDSWMAARAQGHIGQVLLELGMLDESETLLVRAHDNFQRQFGPSNLRADACRAALVELYMKQLRLDDAVFYAETGIEIARHRASLPGATDEDRERHQRWIARTRRVEDERKQLNP